MSFPRVEGFTIHCSIQKAIYGRLYEARTGGGNPQPRALKVLSKRLVLRRQTAEGRSVHENAASEIEIMAMLREEPHPNLLALGPQHEQHHTEDHLVLSMPLMRGGDLCTRVVDGGAVRLAAARAVFRQLASAVAHLHALGYAHRDVSLENVLLRRPWNESDPSPAVVLADFGGTAPFRADAHPCPHVCEVLPGYSYPHAHLRAGDVRAERRRFTRIAGKDGYTPPEAYRGAGYDGPAADAFALGVCLFILLAGVPPCDSARPRDACYAFFRTRRVRELVAAWGKLDAFPAPALDIVAGLMHADPRERLTVEEVLKNPWVAAEDAAPGGGPTPPVGGVPTAASPIRAPSPRLCCDWSSTPVRCTPRSTVEGKRARVEGECCTFSGEAGAAVVVDLGAATTANGEAGAATGRSSPCCERARVNSWGSDAALDG